MKNKLSISVNGNKTLAEMEMISEKIMDLLEEYGIGSELEVEIGPVKTARDSDR